MNRFLYLLRNTYNKRSAIFISVAIFLTILLYLIPPIVGKGTHSGYIWQWQNLAYLSEFNAEFGKLAFFRFTMIFPLVLCVLNIIVLSLAYKRPKLIFVSVLYFIYTFYPISNILHTAPFFSTDELTYAAFYLLLLILCLLFFILLALALFLPLKEPAPRTPRPRKPTKSERIAELERQVEELKRDNQKDA